MNEPVRLPMFPRSRSDCQAGGPNSARPCPFTTCKHYLDEKNTCVLDLAERGGMTLEEVGEIMGLTRERIRQIEVLALRKLKMRAGSLRQYNEP